MKAILLAGGQGTRLLPMTEQTPKPMLPLFGRPVLEHLLLLLRRHGITQAALTVSYLAEQIRDYFGDGSRWGMELTYFYETQPLGTAGAAAACLPFLQGDTGLILSGDCVCDLDLTKALDFHRRQNALATLLLSQVDQPLDYGLVCTDASGRITRFVEKPVWGQVITDQVNTGIYLLEPELLNQVPAHTCFDFGRDLFPLLLQEQAPLYGLVMEGYWRDMGDWSSYLETLQDGLHGRLQLDLGKKSVRPGIWSDSIPPEDVILQPPCWLGDDLSLGPDCIIGPGAVLESNSQVGRGSILQRSLVMGAEIGEGTVLNGAVLCPGSTVGDSSVLNPGSVVGPMAQVGSKTLLQRHAKIWSGLSIPAGSRVNTICRRPQQCQLLFTQEDTLTGQLGQEIHPDLLLHLGQILSQEGKVGLGRQGNGGADSLSMAFAAGVTSGGGRLFLTDCSTAAAAAWCAGRYQLPVLLFLQQKDGDQITLRLFDSSGMPISPGRQRRLEQQLLSGAPVYTGSPGSQLRILQTDQDYAQSAADSTGLGRLPSCVCALPESGGEQELLADSLERLGCQVIRQPAAGIPQFFSRNNGFSLALRTESGRWVSPELTQLLCCQLLLEQGVRELALPCSAPMLAQQLAEHYHAKLYRYEEDGHAALAAGQRQMALRDGCAAGCLIAGALAQRQESLDRCLKRLPPVALFRRDITIPQGRGRAMEQLSRRYPQAELLGAGIRIPLAEGWVYLVPSSRRCALRLMAESVNEETAAELCDVITNCLKESDHL